MNVMTSTLAPYQTNTIHATMNRMSFSRFHLKAILVAGVGFFTDAYDLFIINTVAQMIGYAYYKGTLPPFEDSMLKGAATFGTLVGQLIFGVLADCLGRKKMYGVELLLMIIGTIGSALSFHEAIPGVSVVGMIAFWRFILGVGIGGDYPLSAVITSEYANVEHRGRMMASVFSMQGIGMLVASGVGCVLLAAFQSRIEDDVSQVDYVWRLCLAFGILPALCAVYFRMTLPETPRYTLDVEGNVERAQADVSKVTGVTLINSTDSISDGSKENMIPVDMTNDPTVPPKRSHIKWANDFHAYFSQRKNLRILLGCALSWFLLDLAFYGINLNQTTVLKAIGFIPKDKSAYETMSQGVLGTLILAAVGNVPGYVLAILLIERVGRVNLQHAGFIVLTIIFIVLGSAYTILTEHYLPVFVFLFCIALFTFNAGPNTTTFVIPGEVFPTQFRSTGHGLAAACGKLGAIIASYSTPYLVAQFGLQSILYTFAVIMALGVLSTSLLPETMGKALEDLAPVPVTRETTRSLP